ncbi:hypothetical protein PVK06_036991 [Gossypium arboreum]|uniref:Uncharacterized protein n=1 Tax=Gossypium arboreum TaxID=29729 RepID=A0ABR0NLK6_GOSAR|nr:hypothetical protein PVK06_036991 [Gossypium arboreum]
MNGFGCWNSGEGSCRPPPPSPPAAVAGRRVWRGSRRPWAARVTAYAAEVGSSVWEEDCFGCAALKSCC